MEEEEKNEDISSGEKTGQAPKDFGNVIDALHSKQKLPSLRTYQGDMAEFIKEKNESVISIAVKEKERKEEGEKSDFILPQKRVSSGEGFKMNFVTLSLSILLIAGGVIASLYIFGYVKKEPPAKVVIETEIIPYNNLITLANLTGKNFGTELVKLSPGNGVSILKISDTGGLVLQKTQDFLSFLGISLPSTLGRALKNEYAVGIISQNNQTSYFLVISVNDFGRAFSGMLDWEENMPKDLSFFNTEKNAWTVTSAANNATSTPATTTIAVASTTKNIIASTTTTTSTSTTTSVKVPMKPESFSWKDIIVKNKDTRALVNEKNKARIAYTFLDKNTILITNDLSAIGEMSSMYASRSVAR